MIISRRARRRVLQSMLAAPVLAGLGPAVRALGQDGDGLITAAGQALDVFDFERVAHKVLPPAHFGYLATGVDSDETLHANRAGFANYSLRVRRMVDLSRIDMSVNLFGTTWETPIFLDPVGSQRAFHAEGELAVARAARAKKHLQFLSTVASTSVEDVTAARGAPIWYQLYPTDHWPITQALVRRAEAAGCPVIALTVDLQGGSNRLTAARSIARDSRDCAACHTSRPPRWFEDMARKPMFKGLDLSAVTDMTPIGMDWDYIRRLRDIWPRKLILKGIVTREDAELAVDHGLDGVLVSNHGGRAEDSGRASIDSLVEVVAGVRGRVPVLVDSGFRRGTDVFKALALGATAVGIGRPYIWGLASFGQEGVEKVLDILREELGIAMRQAGTRSLAEINRSFIVHHRQ
ncbi:MAG: alpha-hydroxy-acid oxidizing protein [Steroidobacteraceae bacterium]|nr:alpha-hydroxy-acid oxidizing protein [Steroidobacteraceae bacterium]